MNWKELWFDVGIVRYTTYISSINIQRRLWFDVGIVRYTTDRGTIKGKDGCGLM